MGPPRGCVFFRAGAKSAPEAPEKKECHGIQVIWEEMKVASCRAKVGWWLLVCILTALSVLAVHEPCGAATEESQGAALTHPDSSGWENLFAPDLSNAAKPEGVWTVSEGVLTASEDKAIWTTRDYANFILDMEFKTAPGTNSGVIVYCSDTKNWIPNSVEVQIADDYAEQWAKAPKTWHCGAIFGHLAPSKSMVKKPGEWNRFTITCVGQKIGVVLNGEHIVSMDMSLWTSAKTNPDGSEIPAWLNKPLSKQPTKGKIGLQGKHAGAPIWFRNIKIKELITTESGSREHRKTDMYVTPEKLYEDYEANEIAADEKYKGKLLWVYGTASWVGRDAGGQPYITFEVGQPGFTSVQCFFSDSDTHRHQLAQVRKGEKEGLGGTCAGKSINIILKDCWFEWGQKE